MPIERCNRTDEHLTKREPELTGRGVKHRVRERLDCRRWDGLPNHTTERGKQDVFPAAAMDGFTAIRSVTWEPVQIHGIAAALRAMDLRRPGT